MKLVNLQNFLIIATKTQKRQNFSCAWFSLENFPRRHFPFSHCKQINLKLHFFNINCECIFMKIYCLSKTLWKCFFVSERPNPFLTHIHSETCKSEWEREGDREIAVSCVYCLIIIVLYGLETERKCSSRSSSLCGNHEKWYCDKKKYITWK